LRHRLEYLLFEAVRRLVRLLPRPALLRLGEAVGRLAFRLDRRHREVALQNVGVAFHGASPAEARRLVRDSFTFFGRYLFDLVSCLPAFPKARMASFEYEGLEHVEAAYAKGRGVLFFTAHFGGWELMAMAHGHLGYPGAVVARRLDNPLVEEQLRSLRSSTGNLVIDKRDGLRPMLRALRDGRGIALLIDQNVSGEERVFVDFFGRPASTTPALALLHLRTGAPLVPVFALPLPGDRYRFSYGPPVDPGPAGDRREDVVRITALCTRVLEERIREHPAPWLWMHRRFKTAPEAPPLRAPDPAAEPRERPAAAD
jgi:Kdo2-lipid IVA lauroyltransferase/acyltransferase